MKPEKSSRNSKMMMRMTSVTKRITRTAKGKIKMLSLGLEIKTMKDRSKMETKRT